MTGFICETCGTQYPDSGSPPPECPICLDARQYVGPRGQVWTTLADLAKLHRNAWRQHLPGLFSVETQPSFGIGQRAFVVRTPAGNVLWDCVALLDDATGSLIDALGGLKAIAISHPHYYTTMAEWGRRFGCPVYLHADDRRWVMRSAPSLAFWEGETREVLPGVTLIRCGAHYPGGAVLHVAEGAGLLLSGDILQVAPDRKHISVLWSYPNMVPVSPSTIGRVETALAPFAFDAVYGAFNGREITRDGKNRVAVSLQRYRAFVTGDGSLENR